MQVPVVVITDRALPAGQVTGEITIVSGSLDDKEVSEALVGVGRTLVATESTDRRRLAGSPARF
jgi:hypothetical protein